MNNNVPDLPMRPLRMLLIFDSVLLFLLGASLIIAPVSVENAFHFSNLPAGVGYMLGLWGCGLITMACGYFVAALDPVRHLVWVQVGIARGLLESMVGFYYAARGVISFGQATFGIAVAILITVGYAVLYPRKEEAVAGASAPTAKAM